MKKIIVLLSFCLLIVSCKKNEQKTEEQSENLAEKQVEKIVDEPNIFVVKTRFPSQDGLTISADFNRSKPPELPPKATL